MLAEATTLPTPVVAAHQPVVLDPAGPAIMLAPRTLHTALQPLLQLREDAGVASTLVATEDIYAGWSFGAMSPNALRAFLRHAAATWPTPPRSILLVGDGSYDPKNYSGYGGTPLIPPYLAPVDLWLGETACDTCYGQLDGAAPLDDLLPDLWVGRLPVKSIAETAAVVAKMVAYHDAPWGPWQGRAVAIADNYQRADGTPDTAINFPSIAENSEALLPAGTDLGRMYYDPFSGTNQGKPWRVADAAQASATTRALLGAGAAVVQYTGHGSSYQWASTLPSATPPYLLGLNDVSALRNGAAAPLVLEWTCLTSGFHQPTPRSTTLDEALVLAPAGGAIATWGSTGLGVAHGHDHLQRGLLQALGGAAPATAQLGMLTSAGMLTLFTEGQCCQDALRTFVLLGDPELALRWHSGKRVFVPLVRR